MEVLNFVPEGGARGRGRPHRRLYDTVKEDLSARTVAISTRDQARFWATLADISRDGVAWRASVWEALGWIATGLHMPFCIYMI